MLQAHAARGVAEAGQEFQAVLGSVQGMGEQVQADAPQIKYRTSASLVILFKLYTAFAREFVFKQRHHSLATGHAALY